MQREQFFVDNGAGWRLSLRRSWEPEHLNTALRPLLIVPGYGMNAFIFGFHPTGLSMEAFFANAGFEVWSVNLRNQGDSQHTGGRRHGHLEDYAVTDLQATLAFISENSAAAATRVDCIGASLGGTLILLHVALVSENRMGALINVGGPWVWEDPSPLLKLAASLPEVWGMIPFRGTQKLAAALFPLMVRVPGLLKGYIHPEISDISAAPELVKTVDDPSPVLNRQIAEWVRDGELIIDGRRLGDALKSVTNPLLTVIANADGIVPEQTTLSGHKRIGATENTVLRVGTDTLRFAHADLFVSRYSQEMVFAPMAQWLKARVL